MLLVALMTTNCTAEVPYRLETFATGLDKPWSLAFLPDGSALVTELPGTLRRISAEGVVGEPIENVSPVYFAGRAGRPV
jgi:glucose/arabinose dehydrogenase